jgi:hypothetical protein
MNPEAKDEHGNNAFIPLSKLCKEIWPFDIDLAILMTE